MEDKVSWSHLLQSCILKGHFETDSRLKVGIDAHDVSYIIPPFHLSLAQ